MRGGSHEVTAIGIAFGMFHRKADGVIDRPGSDFVVTHQAWKDRQSGGIGRGPSPGPRFIVAHVPDRLAVSRPPRRISRRRIGAVDGVECFIEPAFRAIQHQHMRIVLVIVRPARARGWIAFNGGGNRKRRHHHIALISVGSHIDGHRGGRGRVHDHIRKAKSALGAEIGMQIQPLKPGRGGDRRRIRIKRRRCNVSVPGVVRGERNESIEARIVA